MTADDRERMYLRLLHDHDAAIRRVAASYERETARRQDLVQDIWLALWQALPAFRQECSERTFAFRIAHNRGVSHTRQARLRRMEPMEEHDAVDDTAADPERAASDRQQRERLLDAVQRLPLALRQATVLMLEGLSHRDIADVLGITENSVAVRLSRARATLARHLSCRGDQS